MPVFQFWIERTFSMMALLNWTLVYQLCSHMVLLASGRWNFTLGWAIWWSCSTQQVHDIVLVYQTQLNMFTVSVHFPSGHDFSFAHSSDSRSQPAKAGSASHEDSSEQAELVHCSFTNVSVHVYTWAIQGRISLNAPRMLICFAWIAIDVSLPFRGIEQSSAFVDYEIRKQYSLFSKWTSKFVSVARVTSSYPKYAVKS